MTQQWQPGYYRGDLVGAVFPLGKKGDVEVHLTFDIVDQAGTPTGNKRTVFLYTTADAMPYTEKKLNHLAWNGDTATPVFGNPRGIELQMRSETYEGKPKEKWDLAPPPKENAPAESLNKFAARWRASAPVPRPATKPPAPPTAKPPPPPPTATAGPLGAATKDQAWSVWCQVHPSGPKADSWQAAINTVGRGKDEALFTGADWQAVADEAIPI